MFHVFSLVCFLVYGVKRRQVPIAKTRFYFFNPQTMFIWAWEVAAGRSLGGVLKALAALGSPGGPRGLGSKYCNKASEFL